MGTTLSGFGGFAFGRLKRYLQERKFRKQIKANKANVLKIVVGSSGIYQKGWIPSEAHFLNLLDPSDWERYFKEQEVAFIAAEHVWEHLTPEQGLRAAQTCFRFLRKGGNLRVAVPDGFHASDAYIERVRPGGTGEGADDHKVLYNYQTFSRLFQQCGFEVKLLEYFDEHGKFNHVDWTAEKGIVRRSLKRDSRNANGMPNYTSLIIDATKPMT